MSGSKKALAMWEAQQLTRMGKPIRVSTQKAAGNGLGLAIASAKKNPKNDKQEVSGNEPRN